MPSSSRSLIGVASLLAFLGVPLATLAGPGDTLAEAARARTRAAVTYDPAYVVLAYPGGDPPADRGVCSDVVVRSYRTALAVDLQERVHRDMAAHFDAYPARRLWGQRRPDPSIDHRRVPNLMRFFERQGAALPVTRDPADYRPGDVVAWNLNPDGFLPHIGIVVRAAGARGEPEVVHNIGRGPRQEAILFDYPILGHYRWFGDAAAPPPGAP